MPTNIPDAPLTREEQYLSAIANGGGTVPSAPLTREEQYLNAILNGGGTVPEVPLTRVEQYLNAILNNGGGGDIILEDLQATDNGTYSPQAGHAYRTVIVAIPTSSGVSF